MFGTATPFVLLDDARVAGRARLYRAPLAIVRADRVEEVPAALDALRREVAAGRDAAGFLAYEAGAALEPRLAAIAEGAPAPLLWFGLFDGHEALDDVPAYLPDPAGAWLSEPRPKVAWRDYEAAFARVHEWIEAGDIYQANLTFAAEASLLGHPLAAYAALRRRSQAGWGGLVWTGAEWLISLSPELFFTLTEGKLAARPMKGTARRGATPEEDATIAAQLAADPKQRAENLMILDLMRNDLTRVARPGTVRVPERFRVETYPTVHQMVSAVTAELAPDKDAIDVLAAIFPCGSVTGAPKIRAMEVIHAVEAGPRGAYTGSIGRIDASGDAAFNVAIRTLRLGAGAQVATLGLGSGVVADSDVREEWEECLAKGAFLTAGQPGFDLIETMAFDPEAGIALLERHLERMKESAGVFGFPFDRHATRNELQAATFRLRDPARVRLALGRSGAIAIGIAPMPQTPERPEVALASLPVDPSDFRLRHKTSARGFYDAARATSGAWEVIFVDADGFVTEGSFTNLFVRSGGRLLTPPASRGLLPGVLRAELIATGRAVEADLTPADLADGFLLGNALRGLVSAVTFAKASEPTL